MRAGRWVCIPNQASRPVSVETVPVYTAQLMLAVMPSGEGIPLKPLLFLGFARRTGAEKCSLWRENLDFGELTHIAVITAIARNA